MTDLKHNSKKGAVRFMIEAVASYDNGAVALVRSDDVSQLLEVAMPGNFAVESKNWNSARLLLAAVTAGMLETITAFAAKHDVAIKALVCSAIGQVTVTEGHYSFSQIDIYPELQAAASFKQQAAEIIKMAEQHCAVVNSLSASVYFHSQVIEV